VTSLLRSRRANDRPRGKDRGFRKVVVSGFSPALACIESERIIVVLDQSLVHFQLFLTQFVVAVRQHEYYFFAMTYSKD